MYVHLGFLLPVSLVDYFFIMDTLKLAKALVFFTALILLFKNAIKGISSAPIKEVISSKNKNSMLGMVHFVHDLLENMN